MSPRAAAMTVPAMECRPYRSGSRFVELRIRFGSPDPARHGCDFIYLRIRQLPRADRANA